MTNTILDLPLIAEGHSAEIYKISQDTILKILKGKREMPLEKEFEIQRQLFHCGIKVPEPFEITQVSYQNRTILGFKMEYIEGKNPVIEYTNGKIIGMAQLETRENARLQKIYEKEIRKCLKFGFGIWDAGLYNSIYSEKGGLYLIDFDGWSI